MAMEKEPIRPRDEATPMGSVWLIVLASMMLTTAVFGGYHWWRFTQAQAEHERALVALADFQSELSAYIAYLEANGTSSPEGYFTQ
jgi:predicted signal transduction protein with EAL and GGDEF domain